MIVPHPHCGPSFDGMRIGLLGGSFNPAHAGHRDMSLYALKRLGLDQVWWLVSPQNPLKSAKDTAPLANRLKRARALAKHPRLVISNIETQLGTRYSVDILRELHLRFRGTRFVWLMGADNLKQIPAWRRWQDIFYQLPVAVFRRSTYASGRIAGKAAQRFARNWKSACASKRLVTLAPPAWLVLDNRYNFLSATAIRKGD